jgi:hypothetical protein
MEESVKKELIAEHAWLVAQFKSRNSGAKQRLTEIEKNLKMKPEDIARAAAASYLSEY